MVEYKYTMTIEGKEPVTVKVFAYPEIAERVNITWNTEQDPVYTNYGTMLYSDALIHCADYNLDFTYMAGSQKNADMYKAWGWPEKNIYLNNNDDYGKKVTFSNGYSGVYCDDTTAANIYNAKNTVAFTVGFVNDEDNEYIPLFQFINFGGAVVPNIDGAMQTNKFVYTYMYPGDKSAGYICKFGIPSVTSSPPVEASETQILFFTSSVSDDDPYDPGGESGTGGGSGDFDNTSIPIDIPSLPSISASSTGFITLYNPSLSELNTLSSYLWSDLFEIDGWKKLFADPMDAILGLSIVPVPILSAGQREVKVGNVGTGISLTVAANQYAEVDCGSLTIGEYWGAYLDYDPYTKFDLYLPYIGTHAISADDIVGKTLRVVYHVDILSGACMAYVKCGQSVLYQFAGQCSTSIPITGNSWTSVINGALSVAASIGSMVATGGASAPLAANAIANTAVNQLKPSIEKSGSLGGPSGIIGIQTPYIIITRPRQALPSRQNEFIGYPALYSAVLSDLTGYTEIEKIHLEGIPATEKELTEIDTLLKGGVIF